MGRVLLLALGTSIALAACAPLGVDEQGEDDSDRPSTRAVPAEGLVGGISEADRQEAIAAAEDFDPFAHTSDDDPPWPWDLHADGVDVPAMVPLDEIRSGGPPPDGIPPIDDPQYESIDEAGEWIEPQEPVMVVEHDGEVRAYPLGILTFHEIVNDEIAGDPLLVTYCPLCNSALVFERTVNGEVLEFGTSGRLWHSNLVMYDRATRSLWAQFTGEAIIGARAGETLSRLPVQMVAFEDVAERWPDAPVLSRDTGHDRPYGRNPYTGYDSSASPFLFDGDAGGPLDQMDRIVAAGGDADPVVYPLEHLREERVIRDDIDGTPAAVFWSPGTTSALDTAEIAAGSDVGATGVFRAEVDGQRLTFESEGDGHFTDTETGSTWTVLGEAVDGPLEGHSLERLPHDDTFWFVQFSFRPDSRVEG